MCESPIVGSDELVAVDLASQQLKWRMKTGPMPADVYGWSALMALLSTMP